MRGPVLALDYWLRYAFLAFPTARFIGKADVRDSNPRRGNISIRSLEPLCVRQDDVYVHVADIEAHLLSIPTAVAPLAVFGVVVDCEALELLPRLPSRTHTHTHTRTHNTHTHTHTHAHAH